jgi:hypothetical protein
VEIERLVVDDVHCGFLGACGAAIDSEVSSYQLLLTIEVGALVRRYESTGAYSSDLRAVDILQRPCIRVGLRLLLRQPLLQSFANQRLRGRSTEAFSGRPVLRGG